MPLRLTSNRDRRFISNFWQAFAKILGIDHRMSATAHPESDGKAERSNKTAIQILRTLLGAKHKDWNKHVTATKFAINSAISRSTGYAPFFPAYSFIPSRIPDHTPLSKNKSANDTIEQMKVDQKLADDNIHKAQLPQAVQYNKHKLPEPAYDIVPLSWSTPPTTTTTCARNNNPPSFSRAGSVPSKFSKPLRTVHTDSTSKRQPRPSCLQLPKAQTLPPQQR